MRVVYAVALMLVYGGVRMPADGLAQTLQVSGGVDARFHATDGDDSEAVLEGVFLNARRVFRDEFGDRWILVAQADADHDLELVRPYQLYAQYKGPLGRWNARAGQYLLPFGLLATYDTERLVLDAIEGENIGIKLDAGVGAFGYAGAWDWAASVSRGIGRQWDDEPGGNYALVARMGRVGEVVAAGASLLFGTIRTDGAFQADSPTTRERKAAVDLTWQPQRWMVRLEASSGTEDGKGMASALILSSYAIARSWDIDAKYALIARSTASHTVGAGASLRLGRGLVFRPAGVLEFNPEGTEREFIAQVYYDFTTTR